MGQRTIWVCDNCGKEESFDGSHPPPHWAAIHIGYYQYWVCSEACLRELTDKVSEGNEMKKAGEALTSLLEAEGQQVGPMSADDTKAKWEEQAAKLNGEEVTNDVADPVPESKVVHDSKQAK